MTKASYNLWCLIGLSLAVYALYVEYQIHLDKNYEPACNFKMENPFAKSPLAAGPETVEGNCKGTFLSKQGKGIMGFVSADPVDIHPSINQQVNKMKAIVAEIPNPVIGIVLYVIFIYWAWLF